jgi:hypothetical protein
MQGQTCVSALLPIIKRRFIPDNIMNWGMVGSKKESRLEPYFNTFRAYARIGNTIQTKKKQIPYQDNRNQKRFLS